MFFPIVRFPHPWADPTKYDREINDVAPNEFAEQTNIRALQITTAELQDVIIVIEKLSGGSEQIRITANRALELFSIMKASLRDEKIIYNLIDQIKEKK
jgi:hypothetical protein